MSWVRDPFYIIVVLKKYTKRVILIAYTRLYTDEKIYTRLRVILRVDSNFVGDEGDN